MAQPVSASVETVVTDHPILSIEKLSEPAKPGANKPLYYTIIVANQGQAAENTPITVTDRVPLNTTVGDVGPDGMTNGQVVTWTRNVTLQLGETTAFTFSVDVGDVPSGTVIANEDYQVASPASGVATGDLYTVTVVDPILSISKRVWPDPPGSNREMTYTLTVLNVGSMATNLVITDQVPAGVTYVRGGSANLPAVRWELDSLDTGESAEFQFTVYVGDVMDVPIVNDSYVVCSAEGVCQAGGVLTSVVHGPTFEVTAWIDPIAKKPGGGKDSGPVTPTLVVRNLGPGNALDARVLLTFERISMNDGDLISIPPKGTPTPFPSSKCGDKCSAHVWVGDLTHGETITFTTTDGQSTIGGEEGTVYTATIVITDNLGTRDTEPVIGIATGKVTHLAFLNVNKSAPPVIGRGMVMTYSIGVWNSALATDEPPYPYLWDFIPPGVTVITDSISHGGQVQTVSGTLGLMTVISWTLPAFGTGEVLTEARSFAVRVDNDLVSGTQIVNQYYYVNWYEDDATYVGWVVNPGHPVTTTVKEVGLIDSYKEVTPTIALPGPDNLLTYRLHIVNSSPIPLSGVTVEDQLPWQVSTYLRDATASAGQVVSDIVSLNWTGDVAPFSSEVVTFTVLVDPYYEGPVANTAVIRHSGLLTDVVVEAVAYITTRPVLQITKKASPDPVDAGGELAYTIRVDNLGQQATNLTITDTVPSNTDIIVGSITAGGQFNAANNQVTWQDSVLKPGESHTFVFHVTVGSGRQVVNDQYGVRCAEGVVALGLPVVTPITRGGGTLYLPVIFRSAPR
jgi:uncharacterized repeat protein (TIGR01451 family)